MFRKLLLTGFSWIFLLTASAQTPFRGGNQAWADSVFATLTLDQKIGQLLMPRANMSGQPHDLPKMLAWVKDYHIGGLVMFAAPVKNQIRVTNAVQAVSKVPMMIGEDLEWGLTHRLDSTLRYPYMMTLGAIRNNTDEALYQMGRQVGRQCRAIGVHINYAPVVDINNNPKNPVIGFRSFGENREDVLRKALPYMKGMQDGGLITSAKHFPGHGDTDVDSHADLPVINHNRSRLDSLEIYPYKKLIEQGLNGVMVAHLSIPALDDTPNQASTLSKKIVTDLLRKELGFEGLIFTDAMEMQGVAKHYPPGVAGVKALLAGNDVLETFTDVPAMFKAVKNAIQSGEIPMADLDDKVKRILRGKAWLGLDKYLPAQEENWYERLNPPSEQLLARQLFEQSLTVLKNKDNILPFKDLTQKTAVLSVGVNVPKTAFSTMAENYVPITHFSLKAGASVAQIDSVKGLLTGYDRLIVAMYAPSGRAIPAWPASHASVAKASLGLPNATYILFGNPYVLAQLEGIEKAEALVVTHQENRLVQELTAQMLFGAIPANGQLPVTANASFKAGDGLVVKDLRRFKFTLPEEVGIPSGSLITKLDSIVNQGLRQQAYPGASVLVAKDGKVIFQKTYGFHTYEKKQPVKASDRYDLASITKITTSVLALMRLVDEGKINTESTLGELFPQLKKSNKASLKLIDVLTHQSGLKAWIPFWRNCIDSTKIGQENPWKRRTFSTIASAKYPVQVTENLFLHRRYSKRIFKDIKDSPVKPGQGYVYSDLSYYLYPQLIQRLTGQPWEAYLKSNFYQKIGANSLTYNAYLSVEMAQIVPTEYDSLFRKALIHGRVHDEGAALLNGISGHAGLFGNALDLAKIAQMYLNGGIYGGERFISEKTLATWTAYPFDIAINPRRGIGFDKPDRRRAGVSAPPSASTESFGHSGFTGTFVWIDPKEKLVYVFLSNRVYPTRNNNKISQLNIRTQFGEMIYGVMRKR